MATKIQLRVPATHGYKSFLTPLPEAKALEVATALLRQHGILAQRKMVIIKPR